MKNVVYRFITAAIWVYFTLLFGWFALYLLAGDSIGALSLVNILAVYLFLPLPLVLIANLFLRRLEIWIGLLAGLLVFLGMWGEYFLPDRPSAQAGEGDGQSLTVMTFNVLGRQSDVLPQVAAIRAEDADVVMLQEVNPQLSEAIQTKLDDDYPYQVVDPQSGVEGMAVISKYPLHLTGETLPLQWVGRPQVLELNWTGGRITLVNFHMLPTTLDTVGAVSSLNQVRESEAGALVDLARRSVPVILAGDANTPPLSDAYAVLTGEVQDAWVQAGFGLGHTFPGSDVPGSSRPSIAGLEVPMWLARIDYIFHSAEFQTVAARLARFDGVSDHRGVVATLKWTGK